MKGTAAHAPKRTHQFKAEAQQLLQLVIHSVYSNRDVFLRELISNASDALDKLRLESYLDKDLEVDTCDLHIEVTSDRELRTLTIRDNGIGMSKDQVIRLIGTLAQSGSAQFIEEIAAADTDGDTEAATAPSLIGQFGIGFYSSFMVADRVTLLTRAAGAESGTRWESRGESTYTIEDLADAPSGTTVTLELKPPEEDDGLPDYSDPWRIRQLVTRYSDFIPWPIRMPVERLDDEEQAPPVEVLDEDGNPVEVAADEQSEAEGDVVPAMETVNSMRALWLQKQGDIAAADHEEFYRYLSGDWSAPMETIHLKGEGVVDFHALLYVPPLAPFDLFQRDYRSEIQLYINRVLVMPDCDSLLPHFLRFIVGVVDARDLTINVSREMLQHDRHVAVVRRRLTKSVLAALRDMARDRADTYATFWAEFGRVLKEGLLTETDSRQALLEVVCFASSHDESGLTTLRQYVDRMPSHQRSIYYAIGESRTATASSPHLEVFADRGIEVLYLTDPIDAAWVRSAPEFNGLPFVSTAQDDLDLDEPESEPQAEPSDTEASEAESEPDTAQADEFGELLSWLTTALASDVTEVRLSTRLTSSPACVLTDQYGLTPSQEKLYRANGHILPQVRRVMEINPTHSLMLDLRTAQAALAAAGQADDVRLQQIAELVHGMALLAEGGEVNDTAQFVRAMATELRFAVATIEHYVGQPELTAAASAPS
ncbi:MAG: htpG [Frankiales bacterium]|nr:htpG [Frankiales bacterium]